MMKKTVLILLVLSCLCGLLAGCGGDHGNEPGTVPITSVDTGTNPVATEPVTEAPPPYDPALDKVKFTDVEVSFLVPIMSDVTAYEFHSDGMNEDAINNVLYARNMRIEDHFDLTLDFTMQDSMEMIPNIYAYWYAGDEKYDIIGGYAYFTMQNMLQGCYENLLNLSYIDVESPWWNASYVEEVTYKDQLYTIVGDANTSVVSKTIVTFFNRSMAKRFGKEEDLLSVVNDKEWTLEYLLTCARDVYEDSNHDNAPSEGDTFGLILGRISQPAEALLESFGFKWINRPAEDSGEEITLALTDPYNVTIMDALQTFYDDPSDGIYTMEAKDFPGAYYYSDIFSRGETLFAMGPMYTAEQLRSTNISYQIYPLPMLEAGQGEYRASCLDSYTALSISSVSDAKQASAAVLEYMGYLSRESLTPAYCKTYYQVQIASDPDTMEMFDSIKDSVIFSFGRVYSRNIKAVSQKMRSLASSTDPVASSLASYEQECSGYLEDLIRNMNAMKP